MSCDDWEEETTDVVLAVCRQICEHNHQFRSELERRVRSGTGTEEFGQHHCHDKKHTPTTFAKNEHDQLGHILDALVAADSLRKMLYGIVSSAASVYEKLRIQSIGNGPGPPENSLDQILGNGTLPSLVDGSPAERRVRTDCLKESLFRELRKEVQKEIALHGQKEAQMGGLMANPSNFQGGPLNTISPDAMRSLMQENYGVITEYVGDRESAKTFEEMRLLEDDGRFRALVATTSRTIRTDTSMWVGPGDLDRERQSSSLHVITKMAAIPFELNAKASLFLQVADSVLFSCISSSGFWRKHGDSGLDDSTDTGRKITCLYFPRPPLETGITLRIWPTNDSGTYVDVPSPSNTLVLMRSRMVNWELLPPTRKTFVVVLGLFGPRDLPVENNTRR